ncbi:hypothetical protein BDR26DRAFT_876918 [Obelidium mucronatum]|nr:hypothetical protein BDR26DRAFT_876918 [Obelidium mucronatum]
MWINRFTYSFKKSFLYWRYLDEAMFRLIPTPHDDVKMESAATGASLHDGAYQMVTKSLNLSLIHPGPNMFNYTGFKSGAFKSLALVELYAEAEARTVLDFRYKDVGDDQFWFIVYLNYKPAESTNWTQTTLIKDFESRRDITDAPIQYDDFYFTVNPVVATSKNGTCAIFLWKGTLHVLDFVGPSSLASGSLHGFTMMRSRLVKSLQSNIRMRGALVDDDGLTIVLVTDTDSVISLKRNYTLRERPEPIPIDPVYDTLSPDLAEKENRRSDSSTEDSASPKTNVDASGPTAENPNLAFFKTPWDIGFLFDAQPAISNIQGSHALHNPQTSPPTPSSPTAILKTLERGAWRLDKLWSPDFLFEESLQTASIVSLVFIPHNVQATDDKEKTPTKLLALLWSNDVLTILNLDESYSGSFVFRFMKEKWIMFVGMGIVVGLFIQNELRWSARDAFLRANFVRPFAVRVVNVQQQSQQQEHQPPGRTDVNSPGTQPRASSSSSTTTTTTTTTTTLVRDVGPSHVSTTTTEIVDGVAVTTSTVEERTDSSYSTTTVTSTNSIATE